MCFPVLPSVVQPQNENHAEWKQPEEPAGPFRTLPPAPPDKPEVKTMTTTTTMMSSWMEPKTLHIHVLSIF